VGSGVGSGEGRTVVVGVAVCDGAGVSEAGPVVVALVVGMDPSRGWLDRAAGAGVAQATSDAMSNAAVDASRRGVPERDRRYVIEGIRASAEMVTWMTR